MPIGNILGVMPAVSPLVEASFALPETAAREPGYGAAFAERLERAVQSVSDHDKAADVRLAKVASGEDVDLHGMMIAMQEADITLRLANSVREKALEAFERIQNMPI